jgi:L-2-hydroxyglutarate oxidase LhgO
MDSVDCIIAGGGVIGLAIARALALRGREVLVIERKGDFGLETSGRNSEVIHAGIYYPPGSLKAALCCAGRAMLVDYLERNALPYRICGKLIVATTQGQAARLSAIEANARANGVSSLEHLDRDQIADLEPEIVGDAGLFSPQTGIFDSRAYLRSLLADVMAGGGSIAFNTTVSAVRLLADGYAVETMDAGGAPFALRCSAFINAAGLGASALARAIGGNLRWQVPVTRYARGTYYRVEGRTSFRHLVYPVSMARAASVRMSNGSRVLITASPIIAANISAQQSPATGLRSRIGRSNRSPAASGPRSSHRASWTQTS